MASRAIEALRAKTQRQIRDQERWIEDHGGSRSGYIARYGAASDPLHFGDGGEAIYQADVNELVALKEKYKRLPS